MTRKPGIYLQLDYDTVIGLSITLVGCCAIWAFVTWLIVRFW